jgi:flagellar hook-associated protein 3 FlgL
MSLRVTQSMMNTQLLRNISNNLGRMDNMQNQLSTGRRINAPSDDPVGMTFAMRYRSELAANDQYTRNVDAAKSSIDFYDMTLSKAGDVVQRARELMVQGSNGSNPQSALDSIKSEMNQLYDQMVEIGNSKFNGKYVFNGEQTDKQPYPTLSLDDPSTAPRASDVTTDPGQIRYELSPSMTLSVNVTGSDVFGKPAAGPSDTTSDNIFQILRKASDSLSAGDTTGLTSLIGNLDSRMNSMLETRAEIGAKTNRIDLIQGRLDDLNVNLQAMQSKTEDADVPALITNLKTEENVYQASLSVGSKLISPSLVDFLR